MNDKKQLILDIQNLLNSYVGINKTDINPALLEFMDEETLKNIISFLLSTYPKTVQHADFFQLGHHIQYQCCIIQQSSVYI